LPACRKRTTERLLIVGEMKIAIIFKTLGITGSMIICVSAIPQIVKTHRTKSSDDLSIMYLSTLMFGLALLQSYSFYVRDFVFIFGNSLSILLTGTMIALWFRYKTRKE